MGLSREREFCHHLKKARDIEGIQKRVDDEARYLIKVYPNISTRKRVFTAYRKHFKDSCFRHPHLEGEAIWTIVEKKLKLSPEEVHQFKKERNRQVIEDMKNLRGIQDVDGHIELSTRLLQGQSYIDLILGLAALTGRRAAEIGTSAKFTRITSRTLEFEGQLKEKGRVVGAYEIPVLHDSRFLIEGLKRLRRDRPNLIGNPEVFHNLCSKSLSERVRKHYTSLYSPALKTKDLRSIYAEICYKLNGEGVSRPFYYARVLGHSEDDVVTAQSYDDFRIRDPSW